MFVFLILTLFGLTLQNVIRDEKTMEPSCGSMDCPLGQRCELAPNDDCMENCGLEAKCVPHQDKNDGSVSDEEHMKMCNAECGSAKNCYIHTSFDAKDNVIHKAVCVKKSQKGKGIFFVQTITPTPMFNPKLLILPIHPRPRMICSIKCGPGKRCEIVDEPCYNSEPCPEIDVCVDDD